MRIEFSKASVPQEIDALCEFDKIVFGAYPSDLFDKEDWAEYDSYWMTLDGKIIGCSAFAYDIDFDGTSRPNCLYIASTGILPSIKVKDLVLNKSSGRSTSPDIAIAKPS